MTETKREAAIRMAREAGWPERLSATEIEDAERLIAIAQAEQREKDIAICCEDVRHHHTEYLDKRTWLEIVEAIRNQGEQE